MVDQLQEVGLPVLQFVEASLVVVRPAPDGAIVRVGGEPSLAAYELMEAI